METIDAIKDRILNMCHERNITINKLANMCGISPSSLKNVLYGKSLNPKIQTIKIICDGLDISLGEFFTAKEFENLDSEIK